MHTGAMVLPARNESSPRITIPFVAAALLAALLACASSARAWFEAIGADEPRIEAGIQKIRELKLKRPVPIFHKTRAQVAQILLSEMKEDKNQEEQDDARVAAGTMLGRYHRRSDVKSQSVKLYLSQIDAFYDQRKKEMVILDGARQISEARGFRLVSYGDWRDNMILAHELTHALEDQNFETGSRISKIADDGDAVLAFKSLIEGDATLAGFAYVRGGMDDSLADFITAHLTDLPQVSAARAKNIPDALSVPFLFQYAEGTAFVREAYRRGGWDSVDAAFRNPPESTAQIIDPTLYFDHLTHPIRISVAGYEKQLAGWNKVLEDTYGELALRLIMQTSFGRDSSEVEVARRWAGDRMVVLTHDADESVIWIIAFNDEQGASLFADFYREVLDRVDEPKTLQGALDENSGPIPHDLEQNGNKVLVIAGPAATQFASLAPAVWQASKISDPNPPSAPPETDEDRGSAASRAYEYVKELANQWLLFGAAKPHDPLKYDTPQ
jgi:hypothetical protein